jgi:hypothetical protein
VKIVALLHSRTRMSRKCLSPPRNPLSRRSRIPVWLAQSGLVICTLPPYRAALPPCLYH